jgi:hypothetical protein
MIESGAVGRASAWGLLAVLLVPWSSLDAQRPTPPRWTIGVEGGAQFGSVVYDEFVRRRLNVADTLFSLETRYEERAEHGPVGRVIARYRPESMFGLFIAHQRGGSPTRAIYTGGSERPDTIDRRIDYWSAEAGFSIVLGSWADGRGIFEYSVAPALIQQTIRAQEGHRDAFARFPGDIGPETITWSARSWRSWGLAIGISTRFPLSEALLLRVGGQGQIVPIGTGTLGQQERSDVERMTGRVATFQYSAFTAHHTSARIGLEYVVSRLPPRMELPRAHLPQPERQRPASPVAEEALRLAAAGDTAAAVELLRGRVASAPEDASAWRELALIMAARAEISPAQRDEAWRVLQRAMHLNPGDDRVLSAYGRVRSLIQRTGAAPAFESTLALSDLSAVGDAAGGVSLGWAIQGLAAAEGTRARYRVQIEIVGPDGESIGLRRSDAPAQPAVGSLQFERDGATGEPVVERVELRLDRARSGPHSVRVRVTDLGTGQTAERTGGFEIR